MIADSADELNKLDGDAWRAIADVWRGCDGVPTVDGQDALHAVTRGLCRLLGVNFGIVCVDRLRHSSEGGTGERYCALAHRVDATDGIRTARRPVPYRRVNELANSAGAPSERASQAEVRATGTCIEEQPRVRCETGALGSDTWNVVEVNAGRWATVSYFFPPCISLMDEDLSPALLLAAAPALKCVSNDAVRSLGMHDERSQLNEEQRAMLAALLGPAPEPVIADALGVDADTVRENAGEVYRRYGVRGRMHLQALWTPSHEQAAVTMPIDFSVDDAEPVTV